MVHRDATFTRFMTQTGRFVNRVTVNLDTAVCVHTMNSQPGSCGAPAMYGDVVCVKFPQSFAPHNSTRVGGSDLNPGQFTLSSSNRFELKNAVSIPIKIFNLGPRQS